MAKQQKTYTREFKVEAVQLVKSSGKPMSQIARELGVSDSGLSHWSKQLVEEARAGVSRQWASDGAGGGNPLPQVRTESHPAGTRHFKKVVSIFSRESR